MTVGMSRTTTLRRVVLPQASRIAVPPLSNTLISLVKDTATPGSPAYNNPSVST